MPGSCMELFHPTFLIFCESLFANSVACYTFRRYHFQFQRGSDLSGRTSYFELLN